MRWSYSGHNTFRRCQRMYFFDSIMASHNAKDERRRRAHVLSHLQHGEEWAGSLLHLGLADTFIPSLGGHSLIDRDSLKGHLASLAKQQYEFSEAKRYAVTSKTAAGSSYCALFVHEYDQPVDKSSLLAEVASKAGTAIDNLYRAKELVNTLSESSWIRSEVPLSWKFSESVTVSGQLDVLAFKEGKSLIVDWKTGDLGSSGAVQMAIYARLFQNKWPDKALDALDIYEVNLLHNRIIVHKIRKPDLIRAEDFVYTSVSEIIQITQDHQYSSQVQRLPEYSLANSPNTCAHCGFRKLCEEMIE